ncbi:MAG TPA: transketolase [Planctomycetota bacterium]|nr:transketolase [Planctomycetota bacterium]
MEQSIDRLCINTIRTLSIDAVQKANSGHPGLPLGAAPMGYVLWQRHLKHNPSDAKWPDRDRFVLSGGHGSMLLYSLLHLTGYGLTMDDIKSFRQWGSRTPGHPEALLTPGLEATAGPLGQGQANAAGMAIAERALAHMYNRPGHNIVDHYTFSLLSDGDMMEGVSSETASLAGHLKLGKLIFLYDSNKVSLDGPTSLTFSTEDVGKRYEACGWHVQEVPDGNTDIDGIDKAIAAAKAEAARPSLIIVHTTIGYGSPHKAGTYEAHGTPLGDEEVALTKKALGWDPGCFFHIPEAALAHFRTAIDRGRQAQQEWQRRFDAWAAEYPDLARQWHTALAEELPAGWDANLPQWKPDDKPIATRSAGGEIMNAIAANVPWLIGGDADLSSSTKTLLKDAGDFDGQTGAGRNIHYGVREHAMAGISNGIVQHGGLRPFCATFFVFSDYMRPAVRLAALAELPVIFIWTHDSIGLGQDGPTHQPVEHLMSLRSLPNMTLIRPCDANETAEAWRLAMQHREGPVGLALTRQDVPVLDRGRLADASQLAHGAYVLSDAQSGDPHAIIIATGSEVHAALQAQEMLAKEGADVRVVSMPSWEIFDRQTKEYRDCVLPPHVTARVSVEAGATLGWERWIGECGRAIGIDTFGASSPGTINMEKFGFTAERVADTVRVLLESSLRPMV